jgi:hypothetical protein
MVQHAWSDAVRNSPRSPSPTPTGWPNLTARQAEELLDWLEADRRLTAAVRADPSGKFRVQLAVPPPAERNERVVPPTRLKPCHDPARTYAISAH